MKVLLSSVVRINTCLCQKVNIILILLILLGDRKWSIFVPVSVFSRKGRRERRVFEKEKHLILYKVYVTVLFVLAWIVGQVLYFVFVVSASMNVRNSEGRDVCVYTGSTLFSDKV